jgi:cytochrome c oxidase accessory protein FixG
MSDTDTKPDSVQEASPVLDMATETALAQTPDSPPAPVAKKKGGGLYEAHKKIHVRATSGLFTRWRWIFVWLTQIIFFGLPWLQWNGRQAVLLHLVERKFYIFGGVFWPQDAFFLAILLILSAYSLFFFTAIAGRLLCGYACPQTVYTEIYMWIEHKLEGNYAARIKLESAPFSGRKFAIKAAKFTIWGILSLWIGFTFVAYFSPVKELLASIPTFGFGPWETFWIFFYGSFTFLFAGMMREQVCKFMCPYARFQSVMFDPDTLVVSYDEQRGEPRGARRKGEDHAGKGDCIDCGICVQVCPTGIDIRNGLQYECIGCGACNDACDQIMDKVGLPRGLVRYSTENALKNRWGKSEIIHRIWRPRTLVYGTVLFMIFAAFIWGLATRIPMRLDISRDRSSLGIEVPGGLIENDYIMNIINAAEMPRTFIITVSGLEGIRIDGDNRINVAPTENKENIILSVLAPRDAEAGKLGSVKIWFEATAEDDPNVKRQKAAVFLYPQ